MKTIDIHIHGGFGINFDSASVDEINNFAIQAYEEGIVAFCPTLTGNTPEYLSERLDTIKVAKSRQKKNEAKIIGVNLEGTFLSKKKSGVQNPNVFMEPSIDNFKKITGKNEDIVKIVVIAPENNSCSDFINYLKNKDIKVHFGHTETKSLDGADCINHLFNAMEQMTHKYETLAIKALLDKNVYTELIADGIHVTDDVIKLVFKVRPLDKILLISDALPISNSNLEYVEFCSKKILKTGLDENGTLGGSILYLPQIVERLLKTGLINEFEANKVAYQNQIDYFKLIV